MENQNLVIDTQFNELLGDFAKETKNDVPKIDIRMIDVNWEDNVRRTYGDIEALADNIKEFGLKDPMKVSTIRGTGRYLLVDGHRRYKAIMLLLEQGYPVKMVNVIKVANSPETRLSEMIITGVHKQTLHPVEQAEAFLRLKNFGWTVAKIAAMLGSDKKKDNMVYRYLKLAEAPEAIKLRCLNGEISHDTVIKIIEEADGDYDIIVSTVEDAVLVNTVVTEEGEKIVRKVQTKDVFKPKAAKESFIGTLRKASDVLFETSEENKVLEALLKMECASVEELMEFFGKLQFKK